MKIILINLERSADRLATFRKVNRHLTGLYVFKAADGQQISNDDFIRSGLVSAELLPKYTRGALGCALSHATLWQE